MRDFSLYSNNNLLKSPFDSRDFRLRDAVPMAGPGAVPDEFESPITPFVYDQGSTSMCCACAYSMIRFMQESDVVSGGSGLDEPLSPAFAYGNRIPGEDFEGMYMRSCCKKGLDGSVLYSDFPGFYSYPEAKRRFYGDRASLLKKARPFAISSYYQCDSRAAVQAAIISSKAVLGGVPIYQSMYSPKAGIIKYDPKKDVKSFGGHAVMFVGWKIINNVFHWRIQNSWGADWGERGRAWIPESYPWIEDPWAVIDGNVDLVFEDYKKKYCS